LSLKPTNKSNFLHFAQTEVDADISILEIYKKMTSYNPCWLRLAFKTRDIFCRAAGLQTIGGFAQLNKLENVSSGSKLDFFTVEKISAKQLLLSAKDNHLSVFVDFLLQPKVNKVNKLSIKTSVYTHNLLGEIYMLPVKPVHKVIVAKMLNQVTKIK